MSFQDRLYISAGLSKILYHKTTIHAASNIMAADRFELKPALGTDAESNTTNSAYYLSTARNLSSGYLKTIGDNSVIIKLDGQRLGYKYKGFPVNYWSDMYDDKTRDQHELEDRVVSNTPFIKAIPYILEIHSYMNTNPHMQTVIRTLVMKCKRARIPLFFYNDNRALQRMDKSKAIPYTVGKSENSTYRRSYHDRSNDSVRPWVAAYNMPVKELVKSDNSKIEGVLRRIQYSDAGRILSADMHNAKSTKYNEDTGERESLDALILIMTKNHWTVEQFVDHLRDKVNNASKA